MGVDTKKAPPLPAPTETDTTTPTEITADVSKPGDENSSYSLPEDGTPVTIRTRGHRANRSQTSLLIEYFEGGKSSSSGSKSERKPSVRVRLTPSKKGKGDHIQLTETKGSRKASLTRRIPLDQALAAREIDVPEGEDANSMTSYASATEESNVSRNPIDIEIDRGHRRRRPASPLIPSAESYQPGNPSEISAIPTDSFLDGTGPTGDVKRDAGASSYLEPLVTGAAAGALADASINEIQASKTRSGGKDRVKIIETTKDKSERKRRSKSRTSSLNENVTDETRPSRRRSSRTHQESNVSGADSSVLSSNLSPSHRSLDTRSMRSGASKSSINNPKLLETVEDAIRRLILPELSALKREQSKREGRRGSLTSTGTSGSRDDLSTDRRRSSSQRGDILKDGVKHRERRNREARHEYDDASLRSPSRDSIDAEYVARDENITSPKRSHNLLKAAAAGAAGAAVAKGLTSVDDGSQSPDRKQRERRRRRTESARSRSLGRERYADEYDDEDAVPAPPMPLMSDINPSELTRTSILSAESERPHSATEELLPVHNTSRDIALGDSTPGRSGTPADLHDGLGTRHANVSHGDLTALPRGKKEYAEGYDAADEFAQSAPIDQYGDYEESRDVSDPGEYHENVYENNYFNAQDVPPPLKYVPYQAGARGLSPIPSVSGYTEAGSEAQLPYNPGIQSTSDVYSSPEKSPQRAHASRSMQSLDSDIRNKDFEQLSASGLRPSGEYSETRYTNEGEFDETSTGQAVRGIAANPNIVHQPAGVESAVASLVDGSMLEQSVVTGASGYDTGARNSRVSYGDQTRGVASWDASPDKMSIESPSEALEQRQPSPDSRSLAQSQEYSEYEVDEYGKFPRQRYRQSPTSSEAIITTGAVGAAAAALKLAQVKKMAAVEDGNPPEWQPAGVGRNKSFKERTMEGWRPRNTPTHSMDRLDYDQPSEMKATGVPDTYDPMPEIGYVDDDLLTNPSVVQERLDGEQREAVWSGAVTPTQYGMHGYNNDKTGEEADEADARGLGAMEATRATALGATAGMALAHSSEADHDQEERQRTSDERKRDTLITNPYEDASPIVNPELARELETSFDAPYGTDSPGFGQKYDEGYMSNGPNRTPDAQVKGKGLDLGDTGNLINEDPFYAPKEHVRHLSGMSQGMASPFYDAATGAGIDRIENKDIVALMQHLMVRDAQRSARDTEIVALLMNAALEMRNSFREMKELVQDTGDDVIFANVENTEKLQKAINGPRPQPGTAPRSLQSSSRTGTLDDTGAKKKNLWKRALQGLSAKGTNDLTRIEEMLMQLLGEVDVLKTQTVPPGVSTGGPGQSLDNLQPDVGYEQNKQYDAEGASATNNHGQTGHLSVSQTRGQFGGERKFSDHRISTVTENEEEYQYDEPTPTAERAEPNLLTPRQPDETQRGTSVPLDTPPQPAAAVHQPLSAENTPRSEGGKKHKSSGSSGWLPKISRWSETTASSVGRAFRGSGTSKKEPKYDDLPPSRSGSSLASYDDAYRHDPYDDKLHSGFSDPNIPTAGEVLDSIGPPTAAFVPPDEAKYQVHRNSMNLQHPQPRPGQSYRTALEYSAQTYDTMATPKSADWEGSATSLSRLPANTNRYSNTSSAAARDHDYWVSSPSQGGPPRPPKEPIESPVAHTPPKSSRLSRVQNSSPGPHQSSESGYGTLTGTHLSQYTGSPKMDSKKLGASLSGPSRRPSGPRAMTPKSPEEEAAREERRRKRDTFGTVASQDTDTF